MLSMRSQFQFLVCAAALIFVTGACSHDSGGGQSKPPSDQPDVAISSVPNQLRFESDVPSEQSAAVNESISSLYLLKMNSSDPSVRSMVDVMGLRDASPAQLQNWMETRVQFIAHDGFDFDQHLSLSPSLFSYDEPGVLPDAITNSSVTLASRSQVASDGQDVVMLNIGTALYVTGKKLNQLVLLDLPGIGSVPMTSPRVGLLEVGPGLFNAFGDLQLQNIFLDIFRAGTLFHEARHSDGHGKTMGFMHSKCTSGQYAGRFACDASINGPYTVGAMVHKNLMNVCVDCTELSHRALQSIYLDIASRTLSAYSAPANTSPGATAGTNWDASPEGTR